MNSFYVLLAFALGWFIAQISKFTIAMIINKGKMSFGEIIHTFVKSGGMPSGHTASFTAATMMIGFLSGFDSTVFALAVCTTGIIVYDAVNVRYAVGQQGKLLNEIVQHHKEHEKYSEKPLKLVEGHTVLEVSVGFIIGICISLVMNLIVSNL